MTIPSAKLDQLADSLDDANAATLAAINGERPSAVLANEADLLGGVDINTTIAAVQATFNTHIARTDNPHNITPAMLGAPTKDDFDTLQGNYLPAEFAAISRYGLLSFIEPPISGSFKGNIAANRNGYQLTLEKDGTLAMLRSGTDGGSNGVYYSYSQNATMGASINALSHTTQRYRPTNLPAGLEVDSIAMNGEGAFAVVLENTAGVNNGQLALIINNDTADAKSHLCYLLPNSIAGTTSFNAAEGYKWKIVRDGTDIYFIGGTFGAAGFDTFTLYKTSIASIAPNLTTPLTINNVGNINFPRPHFGDTWTSAVGKVELFSAASSTLLSDKPLLQITGSPVNITYPGSNGCPPVTCKVKNGKLRIYIQMPYRINSAADTSLIFRGSSDVVLTITLATGAVVQETGSTLPGTVNLSGSNLTVNGVLNVGKDSLLFPATILNNNNHIILKRGFFWTFSFSTGGDLNRQFRRTTVPSAMDDFDALNVVGYTQVTLAANVAAASPGAYATEITNNIKMLGCIPGGIIYSCYKPDGTRKIVLVNNLGAALANYHDPEGVVVRGLDNTNSRLLLTDVYQSLFATFVSGTKLIRGIAARFLTGLLTTRTALIGANGAYAGSNVTLSTTYQNSLITAINAAVGNSSLYTDSYLDVTIPPAVISNVPAIGTLTQVNNVTKVARVITFYFVPDVRTGTLASFTNLAIIKTDTFANTTIDPSTAYGAYTVSGFVAPITLVDNSNSTTFLVNSATLLNVGGSSTTYTITFEVENGTLLISNISSGSIVNLAGGSLTAYAIGVQGIGSGTWQTLLNDTASGIKLLKTFDGAASNGISINENILTVTQQPKDGWLVYFTGSVPIVLGGVVGVLPPTTINLLDIDPAPNPSGDVFYVFVEYNAGVFSYSVKNDKTLLTSNTVMYIGQILTDANGVSNIKIGNTTRIGKFTLAPYAEHDAIPVSLGLPMDAVKILWT